MRNLYVDVLVGTAIATVVASFMPMSLGNKITAVATGGGAGMAIAFVGTECLKRAEEQTRQIEREESNLFHRVTALRNADRLMEECDQLIERQTDSINRYTKDGNHQ